MKIDMLAGEVQFVDHLAPIYLALPDEVRGDFWTVGSVRNRAWHWGIKSNPPIGGPTRPMLVASYGDQKRARRMGRRMLARAEHGAGQSYFGDPKFGGNASYAGGRDNHDVGLFLCPNAYSADRWQRSYPHARVEIVGCPKLDTLPAREPGALTVAVSFHFDINIIPESRSAFRAYQPHLPALAKRFTVIGHAHPKGFGSIARYLTRMGIELVPDFEDVCRRADLYAVDNSSTLMEFASTDRPVVVLNDPGFRRNVVHGGRFWDWADVGLQVDDPATLADTVERALTEDTTAQREHAVDLAYAYRRGGTQRAVAALTDWATERERVAA